MKDLKLELVYIPINEIVPYVNNTRKHSQNHIDQIKTSINEFGMCSPIGIHNGTIIYGHGRFEALKQLKYEEAPVVDLSHLTETQRKALTIADNKIGDNSEFDEDLLKLELLHLDDEEFDYSELGFDFVFDIEENDNEEFEPELATEERSLIRNMTFTVSDEQHEIIELCLKLAKKHELHDPAGLNENNNGNALYYICEEFKKNVG